MTGSSPLPSFMTTPSSRKLSPFSATISSSASYLPASLYHVYPYRLPRHSTLSCPLPTLPCLSCWWTGDSTTSWESSPETTSPTFSEQFSSLSQRSCTALTTAVARWRRGFHSIQRMGYSLVFVMLNKSPLVTLSFIFTSLIIWDCFPITLSLSTFNLLLLYFNLVITRPD